MTDYKGLGTQDRILQLEKEREASRKKLKDLESQLRSEAEKSDISNFQSKFAVNTSSIEEQLKRETVGLVTLDEFTKKRNDLIEEQKKRLIEVIVKYIS
jgi:tRNA U34 5-carboxymethylaminomethyl modifying enzyme MnmG/GidA